MIYHLKKQWLCILALLISNALFAQDKATLTVNLNKTNGKMNPVWAWFGYDEPNYTYMKDGKKLLTEIAALSSVPVYVRTHSLLVTGDGEAALKWGSTNAYTEDAQGNPIYNWAITDSIFDTYIKRGMKPLAQIGFMPQALSTHPDPYRHYWKPGDPYTDIITGWAYPPKDYDKWRNLVYEWVKHCVARYGKKEVESWYWEVWNEPNGHYWKGTPEEFLKMYDYAADGVKRALPTAKIGGNNIAGTRTEGSQKWVNDFIKHCISGTNYATGKKGAPLDALLFHAKGWPKSKDGVVQMDMSPQLQDINTGFKIAMSYPETKNLPLIIGESDPEGCAACGMATNPENAYRNGTLYSSYTAASFARKYLLADETQANFLGAVSWSFEFENQPWFYGFRDLATNGVDKPVLNVFRMFGMMKGSRIAVTGSDMYPLETILAKSVRDKADIGGLASFDKDDKTAAIMAWNYHDTDAPAPATELAITINNIPAKKATMSLYVIDKDNSNSYEVWKKMGSPQNPTTAQIAQLEAAGQLKRVSSEKVTISGNKLLVNLPLQRQAVALVKLEWK
ncbi:GH39 family glycosyl hydrolase [Flavobacterium psychrotrophum]|uniref:GH39 family glycosyl hydrolase n=1 Tax=Flavobacterium psychrotrophum TaxID=2294119 RepID=UPI000E317146|nr:beta-xylosidase [Flavobacterium psychrotrophum]